MTGYVRSIEFESEFEGEKVSCNLKPLSFPDLLKMQSTEAANEEDAARVIAEIVPNYVSNFVGPKASDGTTVDIQEICAVAYFFELSMAIGRRLLAASIPPQKPSLPSVSS